MMLIYGLVLFCAIDWRLAIIIISTSVFSIVIPRLMGEMLTKSRSRFQDQLAVYVTVITDILEGFHIIDAKTIDSIKKRHDKELENAAEYRYEYGKKKSIVLGISELTTKLVKVVTFAAIAILFYKGEISIGTGVATLSYVTAFIEPIDNILYNITTIQSMKEVNDKVMSYINTDNVKAGGKEQIKSFENEIVFNNVGLTREDFKLQNVDFSIKKGKRYAIVGASGSGKSTLIKMLMGYIKPDNRDISIDGMSISQVDLSQVISYTEQKEHIYKASVSDNVTVFNSYSSEMMEKIKNNGISQFMTNLICRNLETDCTAFSGGEKQAIAFMRMMSKDSAVILLDEPFSAMDIKTRKTIENYLFTSKDFADKTIIEITHDTSEENLKYFEYKIVVNDGTASCVSMI